jgi:putative FmdB family regulatory protein
MPIYTYRREDGTTFDIRQKFLDDALETCPTTGQKVARVIHPAGIIFKGSGFYVNDNSKATNPASPAKNGDSNGHSDPAKSESKVESKADSKTEAKSETRAESKSKEKAPSATAD